MGWEAIQTLRARDGTVGLSHFKLLRRLGCGDIGSVYLCELRGTDCYFAMKVCMLPPQMHQFVPNGYLYTLAPLYDDLL